LDKPGRVVVVGDLMLDVLFVPERGLFVRAGGCAANVALTLASEGRPVRVVGRTGSDPNGRFLRETLAAAGVELPVPPARERATGFSVMHRHGAADRVAYVERGANRCLESDAVGPPANLARVLDRAAWLHVSAYGLLEPGPGAVAGGLAWAARDRGIPISVDAGVPQAFPGLTADACLDLLRLGLDPGPDFLILSESMSDHLGYPTARRAAAPRRGFGCAVVTGGSSGAWVDGERLGLDGEIDHPEADMSGAGDAFVGGFIAAGLGGAGPREAARLANRIAARYVAAGPGWRRVACQEAPVLVSACLFDTASAYDSETRRRPAEFGDGDPTFRLYLPVCPEQAGGLTTPRLPAEIRTTGGGAAVIAGRASVVTRDGRDVTPAFLKGTRRVAELARATGATRAILKEGSPSCGATRVDDGTFSGRKVAGEGVTVAALRRMGVSVSPGE